MWERALQAWREAGLDWEQPGDWEPADTEDRTEPIPVVPAQAVPGESAVPGDMAAAGEIAARPWRNRRTMAAAAAALVVIAAGVTGGIVATRPGSQAVQSRIPGLYPPAQLADGEFAAPPGVAPSAFTRPSLTAVAAVGRTVVAAGAVPALPSARPLIVVSTDGGRAWRNAVLQPGAGVTGPGGGLSLVAGGHGEWLALGRQLSWISHDGLTWQPGPGIAPLVPGDKVLALARTAAGFVAAGENVSGHGRSLSYRAVLWASKDGLAWQRMSAATAGLKTQSGNVLAFQWAAARGNVVLVGGKVAGATRHGRTPAAGVSRLWRSGDGGITWSQVGIPVAHGATGQLAGVAATATGFVAVGEGQAAGHQDGAVAFTSAQGEGSTWRFASRLMAAGGAAFHPAAVAGSNNGVVVTGTAGAQQAAFASRAGLAWRQAPGLGPAPATTVTGATAGPHAVVVATGATRSQPAGNGRRAARRPHRAAHGHRPAGHPLGQAAASAGPLLLLARGKVTHVGQNVLVSPATATVADVAAAAGKQVAVGAWGGIPAIWWSSPDGRWSPAAISAPATGYGAGARLTSVTHGRPGWLAVGTAGGPGGQPLLLTSPDGLSWHAVAPGPAFAAPRLILARATAGPAGYVVAGSQASGGTQAAAAWFSPDLVSWQRASASGLAGGGPAGGSGGSQVLAVIAVGSQFLAGGSSGHAPAVWASSDGSTWHLRALPVPAGAGGASITHLAVAGHRVVALGTETAPAGDKPFGAVSANGGATWRETALPAGGGTTVTALAGANGLFVAAGTTVSQAGSEVGFWRSPDGLAWQPVAAPGAPLHGPGARELTALTATGPVVTGVGYAVAPAASHPVIWHARLG